MNLQEQTNRIKQMMGLIIESTDKIQTSNGGVILVSDYVKNHIKDHNQFGSGSVFKEGITDEDINSFVNMVIENNELGEGGAFEIEVPGIGFDLVKPYDEAMSYDNAEESTTIKREGPNEIEVPLVRTSQSEDDFMSDRLKLIIRPSNTNFLPEDVKEDGDIMNMINQGKVYSLLTAFPGNPNIPRASEWGGQFAVIVPTKEIMEKKYELTRTNK
jgi:hypothetical protein